jgi:hypothetical protein
MEIDLDRALIPEITTNNNRDNQGIYTSDFQSPSDYQYPPPRVSEKEKSIETAPQQPEFQLQDPVQINPQPPVQPMSFQSIEIDPHEPLLDGGLSMEQSQLLRQQQNTTTSITMETDVRQSRRLTSNNTALDEINTIRKKLATDPKTSTEYTLHIIFTQFVRYSERKLNMCLTYPLSTEPPSVDLLAEGVDPDFDKIIASLGYISRNNPKPVIDSVMFWRKSKSEVASMAANAAEKAIQGLKEHKEASNFRKHAHSSSSVSRFSHRRNTSSKSNIQTDSKSAYLEAQVQSSRETAIQGDRKSLISIYILCRVLIEVVKQVTFDASGDDLGDKLEEIVFSQLRSTDPILISSSIIRSANWNLFAELLGYMSEKRFLSVSDRFIADLEKIPPVAPKDIEPSIHLLIHGMRYLKLRNYPLEHFEESADFLQSIAKFFSASKSHSIKAAYSQVLSQILLPLAESVTAEVNHPIWSDAIHTIYKICGTIDTAQKNWLTNLTLATSVLCVAPSELFLANWYGIVDVSVKQLKVKNTTLEEKITLSTCIARLIWVYMFRCTETLNNTTRKIDSIIKSMFLGKGRLSWLVTDASIILPLVQIFRAIGYAAHNPTVENFIIPLLRSGFNGHNIEGLQHEKVILAIKSYTAILGDEERPVFPENPELVEKPDININIKTSNHEEICRFSDTLLTLLNNAVGPEDQNATNTPTTPFYYSAKSPFSGFRFGSDLSVQIFKNLNTEVLAVVIEATPWLTYGAPRKLVEILCRNSLHEDFRVANAAASSLRILSSKKKLNGLISTFAKFAFNFSERSSHSKSYVISKDLLRLYLDMLEHWLTSLEKKEDNSQCVFSPRTKEIEEDPVDELELKNTITVIEEVEGHGLFFLASQDFEIRKLGLTILRIVESFDEALYEKTEKSKPKNSHNRSNSKFAADVGTRVYFILQSVDFLKMIGSQRQRLSVAERSRLSKLSQKARRDVLIRLAESDYGVDSALWFRIFPKLLNTIFEKCPITMALCRSIVCTRLVQIHENILEISSSSRSLQTVNSAPSEVLVEQWKLYLIVACTSLTSTTEQRIHIPDGPSHGKKKSQQLLTIQQGTITSARSVFRLTLNLLNCSNQCVIDAIITGLSCMNINIFQTFLEAVEPIFSQWEKDLGSKYISKDSRLRIEVTHILNLVSKFMEEDTIILNDWIVEKLIRFTNTIKVFLSQAEVQHSFEFQKLRRYFCGLLENFYMGIQRRSDPSNCFPFETRVSCFTFLEEWCGHGKSSVIAKQRYAQMTKYTSNSQELNALNTAIEFERQILTMSAINAMVALLNGKIEESRDHTILKFDLAGLLSWIDLLLDSSNERISSLGKKALKNIFKFNTSNTELLNEVYKKCIFEQKFSVIENYYVVMADALVGCRDYPLKDYQILLLVLYGVGFSNLEIRSSALNLMIDVEKKLFDAESTPSFSERVKNKNKTIYKRALLDISAYFASNFHEMNINLISELTKYFTVINFESRRDLLTILLPWLHTVELHVGEDSSTDIKSFMVLSNLLEITITFSESIPNEIEALWISLGNGANFTNSTAILRFVLHTSLTRRNPIFVEFSSKILVYLSGSCPSLVDSLVSYIDHKSMVPPQPASITMPTDEIGLPYVANVWKTLKYTGKDSVFSLGQLSLIFLSDLIVVPKESLSPKIPLLLHVSFVLLDHYLPIVQESSAKMIIYILSTVNSHPKLEQTKELIRNNQKCLWTYDDLNNDRNGARSPRDMDLLVRNILEIFSSTHSNIQKEWGSVSLSWATNCAVRHIACRSFQVFRSLLSFLDQSMLKDMLHRLSNTISDVTPDIQGFAMQILMTLNAITSELDAEKLIDFPQLFWATVASLHTINEHEYIELLSVLNKFLSKIDLDSEETVQCLVSTFPSNWEGKFEGLQQIVMIGLRSSASWEASLQLLDKLNKLKDSEIIADDSRLLFSLLTNIPRYLHAFDEAHMSSDVLESAEILGVMATSKGETNLARIVDSFVKNKFRTKDDFLGQLIKYISERFLMDYSGQTVIFLLGLLANKINWVKRETMRALKLLFPKIDLSEPHFQGCGADLISPLLRLLLTPFAQQALDVLDETTSISGSKLDKDILRMSLGNKTIRKDYEKTATLFGIPEDSGWSIPMPAITAATTRNNVHAVFSTCVALVETETPGDQQEQIKFHLDDYRSGSNEETVSVAEENDASLSHMWAELDNLDSFFTKDADSGSQYSGTISDVGKGEHFRSTSVDTRYSHTDQLAPYESAPQIYDKKVSVILNRSLARTQSNTSFKTSLADSFANTDNRHLSSISTRDVRSRIGSPIMSSSPVSPSSPLSREDLFRFEGVLGQPQQRPKKKTNRFTAQPEYLPNLSNISNWGSHSTSNPPTPTHGSNGRTPLSHKSSTFSLNRDKRMFHQGP